MRPSTAWSRTMRRSSPTSVGQLGGVECLPLDPGVACDRRDRLGPVSREHLQLDALVLEPFDRRARFRPQLLGEQDEAARRPAGRRRAAPPSRTRARAAHLLRPRPPVARAARARSARARRARSRRRRSAGRRSGAVTRTAPAPRPAPARRDAPRRSPRASRCGRSRRRRSARARRSATPARRCRRRAASTR